MRNEIKINNFFKRVKCDRYGFLTKISLKKICTIKNI